MACTPTPSPSATTTAPAGGADADADADPDRDRDRHARDTVADRDRAADVHLDVESGHRRHGHCDHAPPWSVPDDAGAPAIVECGGKAPKNALTKPWRPVISGRRPPGQASGC